MSARRASTVIATLVVACAALYWLLNEFQGLYQHIQPGRGLSPSSSMIPHEISLKLEEENGKVNEWNLAVPRAFVIDETGENGSIAPFSGSNTGYFTTRLHLLQADDGSYVPESLVDDPDKYAKTKRITIGLGNSKTDPWTTKGDFCIPQHRVEETASKFGGKEENKPCYEQSNACHILGVHADGWVVGIVATKDLYSDPDTVCKAVKSFLEKYTQKRDHIKPGAF